MKRGSDKRKCLALFLVALGEKRGSGVQHGITARDGRVEAPGLQQVTVLEELQVFRRPGELGEVRSLLMPVWGSAWGAGDCVALWEPPWPQTGL